MCKDKENNYIDTLNMIYSTSCSILSKEILNGSKYRNIDVPEVYKKETLCYMFAVEKELLEYTFLNKMKQTNFKSVIDKKDLSLTSIALKVLVKDVSKRFSCYHEITDTVISFLDELKNKVRGINDNSIDLELTIHKCRKSIEMSIDEYIKEHSEYSKIKELITLRNKIESFFESSWNLYAYNSTKEVEKLSKLLEAYKEHVDDVRLLEDKKLKSIICKAFFKDYYSKIEAFCLLDKDFVRCNGYKML